MHESDVVGIVTAKGRRLIDSLPTVGLDLPLDKLAHLQKILESDFFRTVREVSEFSRVETSVRVGNYATFPDVGVRACPRDGGYLRNSRSQSCSHCKGISVINLYIVL